ncbi:MAG: TonB family protein [Gluconacetobacter diazotrophicus]|nr:TonB family protein [Gluconacetobacter diazotrophicus]
MSRFALAGLVAGAAVSAVPERAAARADPDPLRAVTRGAVAYPPELLQLGIEGRVTLDCAVSAAGVPEGCAVTESTDHRFDAAVLAAETATRYAPATDAAGRPVRVPHHVVHVNFVLNREPHRTELTLTCRLASTGRVDGCTPGTVAGYAPNARMLEELVGRASFAPATAANGVTVPDPGRMVRVAGITREMMRPEDASADAVSGYGTQERLFRACWFGDDARHTSCGPVGRDEAIDLLQHRSDARSPALTVLTLGVDPKPR